MTTKVTRGNLRVLFIEVGPFQSSRAPYTRRTNRPSLRRAARCVFHARRELPPRAEGRSQSESRDDSASIGDTTCGNYGNRDGISHLGHKRKGSSERCLC